MNYFNQKWVLMLRTPRDCTTWAITLGQNTFYSTPWADPAWQRHEDCHKAQWAKDGLCFMIKYLWYSARLGYWNNPYEIEARKAENL